MKSASDLFLYLLRLLGLLDEHPLIRKNIKRNSVFDDFSSDDDTPLQAYKQLKKFRWSDIEAIDNQDEATKQNNRVRTVPEQIKGSYTTSTPNTSSKRNVPVDLLHLSRNRPSPPLRKITSANTVIDADLEQKGLQVESISNNKNKKAPILHVDLDDDDNDEVVFVNEVATPEEPLEPFQEKNGHPGAYAKILPIILEAIKSDKLAKFREQLQRIANTIESMPKDKPLGDDKLAKNMASYRPPQKTQIKEIKFDRYQNTHQEPDPIRVSLTDSSDSDDDVEIVPATATTSSKTKSARNIEELSRSWLLELDAVFNNKQQNNQEKVNDARRVSDITIKVSSDQNIPHSRGHDETDASEDVLSKLASDYNITELHNKPKIQKTQENHNDSRRASNNTPIENIGQNEAGSLNRETIGEWLARIEAKYFSTPPDKLDVNHESNIIPKVSAQNKAQSYKPEVPKNRHALPSQNECDAQKVSVKTQEKHDDLRRESDTRPEVNSEENEARSYLPAASRDWLAELDAKYKTTPQNNQENLENARNKLNQVSKVNDEQSKSPSVKPDSPDDWLEKRRSRYNDVQREKQGKLNGSSRESSNENKLCSQKPDTAEERPSQLASKHTIKQPNNAHEKVNNVSKTNSRTSERVSFSVENETRSFNFNTSEELLSKLSFLYNKYQGVTHKNSNKSKDDSAVETKRNDLPVLTPEQDKLLDKAFEPEPEDELLIEKFNMRIHRRDLQTLSHLNWLNDEIINFYMNLIMQRSEKRRDLPRVYATNTFFYPKLMQNGQPGLRRWTRKVDIFAYDLFMVPVNIGNHWCLSIVDFRARVIKYLDSQGEPNRECLDALMQYLEDEHEDKKSALFDDRGWKMECVTDIPQQMNGSDCGMFTCTFAEFSSRDAAYSFTQAHMPYLRRKAAVEILMGKLLL